MARFATVDSKYRLQPTEDAREWFPPGAQFLVEKNGDTVTLKRVDGLTAHLRNVETAGDADAMSWNEIDLEVQAYRRERAELGPT